MWQQPHIVVMDEPTNYLDRDALGALACAVKEFGGVLLITTTATMDSGGCVERGNLGRSGTGEVIITGNRWGQGKKGKAEATNWDGPQEDTVDAMGNTVKVKGPKKKLSRKDIKAKAKSRAIKLAAGQDLTTDSDWDLDVYIGEDPSKAKRLPRHNKMYFDVLEYIFPLGINSKREGKKNISSKKENKLHILLRKRHFIS